MKKNQIPAIFEKSDFRKSFQKKTSKKYTFSFYQNKTLLQNPKNSKIA